MRTIEAFDDFYKANQVQLVRSIRRLVDHENIAEEIAQEAFSAVWNRWIELDDPAGYLYRVGFNRANDELRKRRTHRSNEHLLDLREGAETIYLDDALASISEKRRTAIYHKFFSGYTNDEVGELMDIPTGTVKSLIHRGLNELRETIAA